MQLPRGITGFGDMKSGGPPPTIDVRAFRANLYAVARKLGAQVMVSPKDLPEYPANYIHSLLAIRSSEVRVLLNVYQPYLSFVDGERNIDAEPLFISHPDLEKAFSALGTYKIVDAETLNSVANDDVVALLSKAEQHEYRYWSPCRVGDVIFNGWD